MTLGSPSVGRALRRLSACGLIFATAGTVAKAADEPAHPEVLDRMIVEQAKRNGVPEKLVRRIVMRESKYDPRAHNHVYWGLMQISYPTAKSMGFKGTREELLNPLVNLTYAVPYLANAFVIAGKREDEAVRLYAAGYYFTARKRGLLSLMRTAESAPLSGAPDGADEVVASAVPLQPPISYGIFGSLFGANQPLAQPTPQQVADAMPAQGPAPSASSPGPSDPAHVNDAAHADPAHADIPNTVHTTLAAYDDKDASAKDIVLVADKNGDMQPPKKWRHDGGMTRIARGEQSIETVAAYAVRDDEPARKTAHSHKTAVFALIDATPPSGARAYASADGQEPRVVQASSQAAISAATSPQPASDTPQDAAQLAEAQAAQQMAASQSPQADGATDADQTETPRKLVRKAHHHGSDDGVSKVAKSKSTIVADAVSGKHVTHHAKSSDGAVTSAHLDDDDALRH